MVLKTQTMSKMALTTRALTEKAAGSSNED